MFRIRIDDVNDVATQIAEWAEKVSTKYFVVHHLVNANSHFHIYVDQPMILSAPAMRYKVKAMFKLEPVNYSVGSCDPERITEFIQYCFNTKHGNTATVVKHNLDPEFVNSARAAANVVSATFDTQRTKKITKSLYDIALECDATGPVTDGPSHAMIKHIMLVLHKYLKCHDRYLVCKVMFTVESLRNPDKAAEYIMNNMI